jgi:methyl-accepting chemotaxis protein
MPSFSISKFAGDLSPRMIARSLGVAFALLLAVTALMVGVLLHNINVDAEQAVAQAVRGAVETHAQTIRTSTFTTSRWDDAARKLYGKLDPDWALFNLGLTEAQPEHTYVIDGTGRTHFAVRWDRAKAGDLKTVAPDAVREFLRTLPRTTDAVAKARSGVGFIARYEGKPAFFAAAAIMPETSRVARPRGNYRYVVHIGEITPRMLASWATAHRITNPTLVEGAVSRSEASMTLKMLGANPAHIEWTPPAPAGAMLKRLGGLIVLLLVMFGAIAVGSIRLITHASDRLLTSRQRAHSLAGQAQILANEAEQNRKSAEEARRVAEEALEQSRADRVRIEHLSRQEAQDRSRHAQQLRDSAAAIAERIDATALALTARLTETARELDNSAHAAVATINHQHQQALAITEGTQRATTTIRGVLDRMRSVGTKLLSVSEETRGSRTAIETCMTLSLAARDSNQRVQDQVEQVGKAAEAIAEVTARTRMLALNAAIEAARAGEAGQSFAVVANEVKALAAQIDDLNRTVASMAASMGAAASQSWSQSDSVRDALSSLNQSAALTIETILSQQAVTQQVVEASDEADGTAQRIADNSHDILASLDEVRAQSGRMQASARNMRTDVESLSDMLSQFVADLRATA